MTQPLKLNYTILSKEPKVLIKFFYEGSHGEYAEFKMELEKLPGTFDANRKDDPLAVNGTAEVFSNNSDGALDLVAAFAKAMKTEPAEPTEETEARANLNDHFRNPEDMFHQDGGKCEDPRCEKAHFPF